MLPHTSTATGVLQFLFVLVSAGVGFGSVG